MKRDVRRDRVCGCQTTPDASPSPRSLLCFRKRRKPSSSCPSCSGPADPRPWSSTSSAAPASSSTCQKKPASSRSSSLVGDTVLCWSERSSLSEMLSEVRVSSLQPHRTSNRRRPYLRTPPLACNARRLLISPSALGTTCQIGSRSTCASFLGDRSGHSYDKPTAVTRCFIPIWFIK